MKLKILTILLILMLSGMTVSGQDWSSTANVRKIIERIDARIDSLKSLYDSSCYQDTNMFNPMFLMPVFKPIQTFTPDIYRPQRWTVGTDNSASQLSMYKPITVFQKEKIKKQISDAAYLHILFKLPYLFKYTIDNLPSEKMYLIEKNEKAQVTVGEVYVHLDENEAPKKFIPDRKYWISGFESAIKFSENSTSGNWYSGPIKTTILNIFTRNIVKYNYAKDRIKWDNDLELRLNFYNSPNDTLRRYKVSDDFFRLHSNYGLKAFNKWYYTIDSEFKTQLFSNYQENTNFLQAGLLSPFTFNIGVGVKYDLTHKYNRPDRSLAISLNLAPLSYTYMSSRKDDIDWGRHGFPKDDATGDYKHYLSRFGSTADFNMNWKITWDVVWKSRLKYFTTYDRVVAECENSLDFAISRFFSTLLYLNLRYDDGVTKVNESDSFLQWNQLISFGFSYKW
ncbi:MAG: DUF3078 domain-containing protein [Tannerella sp.]|jgi:hypothetical protein|nr:DUF3078 domain-containing protein [Tannerella sp.]